MAKRGFVLTTESILLSAALTIIIVIGAYYLLSTFSPQHVTITTTTLKATYCGDIVFISNVGNYPAEITYIATPSGSQANVNISLPYTIYPGSFIVMKTSTTYSYITIVGNNFEAHEIVNGCLS